MKTINKLPFLLFALLMGSLQLYSQVTGSMKMSGNWQGDIGLPNGMKITMIFRITEEEGNLKALMDVPAQGARDIPVDQVEMRNDSLFLSVKLINGLFSGSYNAAEKMIDGKWIQNGVSLPLKLSAAEKTAEMKRPQEPKRPLPYKEEEVSYENKAAGIKLAGTLTFPVGTQKAPAVILISGSGAQNRDEELMGHKPFFVLSDYLTRNGIAVLRVDDRGVGGSTGNIRQATSEDFAGDVLAGLEYLKNRPEIDARKIGLAGHSEGGIIAPIAAVKSKDVAFIVLLAGPGLVGEQILYLQARLLNKGMGMTDEQADANNRLQETIFKIMLNEQDSTVVKEKLRITYTAGNFESLTDDQKKAIDSQIASVNTPWFKFFLKYDPRPTLEKVKCPTLALIGGKDLQVPPDENLKAIEEALAKAKNKNYKTIKLERLNHLFQNCKTGLVSEYAEIEETMSPIALETVSNWILEVVR